ncbi:MAG: symmetrical bis(5'-nucleosyl)-tetraphosphatase, partial [Halocynthiibacter sp.]
MTVYAVGDVQGCVVPLEEMLDTIRFDPALDQLWLTGDLVNRGRHSLQTLRLVKGLGRSAITVLGNHDLHLLAVAAEIKRARPGDTMQSILRAPDRDELLDWLRRRPLVHWDKDIKSLMVHAGIYPGWQKKEVVKYAAEIEKLLRGDDYHRFLENMYGRNPARWDQAMGGWERARFITNVFTRMRYCDRHGNLNLTHKGPPGSQPRRLIPWFNHANMKCRKW